MSGPAPSCPKQITGYHLDDEGDISPLDVLVVINELNRNGIRILATTDFGPPFIDVNGNNSVDPIDVLQLINYINGRNPLSSSEEEGEGEASRSGWLPKTLTILEVWHEVDNAWSVPDYFDIPNIRKRAQIIDAAFIEFGDDMY